MSEQVKPLTMAPFDEAYARTVAALIMPDDRVPTPHALLVQLRQAYGEIDALRARASTEDGSRNGKDTERLEWLTCHDHQFMKGPLTREAIDEWMATEAAIDAEFSPASPSGASE